MVLIFADGHYNCSKESLLKLYVREFDMSTTWLCTLRIVVCAICVLAAESTVAGPRRVVHEPENFAYMGQELGVSTYDQGKTQLAKTGAVTTSEDGAIHAKVLIVTGKQNTNARYSYVDDKLARITVTAPASAAAASFAATTKQASPIAGRAGIFRRGNGTAELASLGTGNSELVVQTTALAASMQEAQSTRDYWRVVAGISVVVLCILCMFPDRAWYTSHKLRIADSIVSALTVGGGWYFLREIPELARWLPAFNLGPNSPLATTALAAVVWIGGWRTLAWAIGAVRTSGWILGDKPMHSAIALQLVPVLLIPAVLRNCAKSPQYCGLVIVGAELVGLTYYRFSSSTAVIILSALVLLAPGIVRLYAYTLDKIGSHETNRWWPAIAASIGWPLAIVFGVLLLVLCSLLSLLKYWWVIALFAIVGMCLDQAGGGILLAAALVMLPVLLPAMLSVGVGGFAPTGFGGMEDPSNFGGFDAGSGFNSGGDFSFGSIDINPANGLPMFDGIGGFDIAGNTFGFDMSQDFSFPSD